MIPDQLHPHISGAIDRRSVEEPAYYAPEKASYEGECEYVRRYALKRLKLSVPVEVK